MNLHGFTKQEYDIIKQLLLVAKKVNVTICTDNLDLGTNQDSDIFYSNKKTADKLLYIARSMGILALKMQNLYTWKRIYTKTYTQFLIKMWKT